MITIFTKTDTYEGFVADMKALYPDFVTQDENGDDMLIHYSHDWSIDYIGYLVDTPAEIDEDGNLITSAVLSDSERANVVIHDSLEEWFLQNMPTSEMANGTSFTEVSPVTPKRIFSGQRIEVDRSKVDETLKDFEVGIYVQAGHKMIYQGITYRVGVPHKTQADWTPDVVPALFREVIDNIREWSSFASHEFQAMDIGTKVTDEGKMFQLTNPGQGHRKPSGQHGHFGWSEV